MSELRGLSLTQPWASLIAIGAKKFETRSWETSYRGLLVLHASRGFPSSAVEFAQQDIVLGPLTRAGVVPSWWQPWHTRGYSLKDFLPLGVIIAVARLAWCFKFTHSLTYASPDRVWRVHLQEPELSFGDFSIGRFGFLLVDVRPLPTPIPCRGHLGLWRVSDEVVAQIRSQGVAL